MEITLNYILVCSFCIASILWMVWHVLTARKAPKPGNGGDGGGGIPSGFVFPPFDPPSGHGLDDWLVDRLPKDMDEQYIPLHPFELVDANYN